MSGDLKQELLVCLSEVYKEDGYTHTIMRWKSPEEQSNLRARLQKATVTEPELTDAELRAALWVQLPEGWRVVSAANTNYCRVSIDTLGVLAYPTYAALRAQDGIKNCAAALLVLAGVQGEGQ